MMSGHMFIDANIFIYAYENVGSKAKVCKSFLKRVQSGESKSHTSVLVLNEVLYYFCTHNPKIACAVFKNILAFPNLTILAVDEKSLIYVADLIMSGLSATDAYHVSVMKSNSISTICSYDTVFDRILGIIRQVPK